MPFIDDEAKTTLNRRISAIRAQWDMWAPQWEEIRANLAPWRSDGLTGNDTTTLKDGSKRHQKVFDPTPEESLGILAAGFQSGLTSPARPWFRLSTPDPELREFKPAQVWIADVEKLIYSAFARSNVYDSLHHTYLELGAFATAAMFMEEDATRTLRTRAFTAGEFMLATDDKLRVDTFYREVKMTVAQIVQSFGIENVGETISNLYKNGDTEKPWLVSHLVEPNDERMKVPQARGMKFRSIYWLSKGNSNDLLRAGGFRGFPYMAPRWGLVGASVYGYGPGHRMLPDVKSLHFMRKKYLIAVDKTIEPPLVAPGSLQGKTINTVPGGITYDNSIVGQGGVRPLYEVRPDLVAMSNEIEQVRQQIRRGFFNDVFRQLIDQPTRSNVTREEILSRNQEKMLMLGPVLEAVQVELLNPLIDRTFDILAEQGFLPEPPPDLQGVELKVEYTGVLAQAQKAASIGAIQQFVGFAGNLAGVAPQVLDKIDFDQTMDEYAEATGVPVRMRRSDEETAGVRDARAEQEAQAAAAEQALQAADGAKTLSETDDRGNNLLNTLLGGGGLGQ